MTMPDSARKVIASGASGSVVPWLLQVLLRMELGCFFFFLLLFIPSEALSAPCENGGTAVGEGCVCPPGYNGTRCETSDPAKACQNGGTAVGTKCYCPPGFRGPLCQHPDPASACQNGATAFGMVCVCPPGYQGEVCQYPEKPSSCLNGGTLVGAACHCPPAAWGPRCECTSLSTATVPTTAGSPSTASGEKVSTPTLDISSTAHPMESHATVPTTLESNTTATLPTTTMESKATATLVTPQTRHATATPAENNTMAMENNTTATLPTPWESNATATTLESNTTATVPTTLMVNNTMAMKSSTTATSLVSNTTATLPIPVESNTTATESNTTATVPTTPMVNNTTAMESNTTATLPTTPTVRNTAATESNTTATLPISTESNTTVTPLASNTTATLSTPVERNTTAMESNTRSTTLESKTTATPVESNTTATLSTVPTNASATPAPAQSTVTHTVPLDATTACAGNCTSPTTKTTAVTPPSPPTMTSSPDSTTITTWSSSTNRATTTSTNTTLATFCLYLPHGSNPPAIICHNGGVTNLTECLCPPGYSGPTCKVVDVTDQCADGSTAVGNRCICPPGRSGPRCETRDEATACQNGGTAVGTECYCPGGFYGPRCEYHPTTPVPTSGWTTTSRATPNHPTRSRATPRSTRRTTTTPIPTTTDPCQNGGRWTGTGCLCPLNVDGAYCQFGAPTINITAELENSVMMLARVTNRNFSEDMRDTSSTAYRSFVDEFSRTMDRIYHNVSGYRGTRVLTLTRGSVVVNYKVLLHPPAGDTSLDPRAQELLEAASAAPQPQNCSHLAEGLCFSTSSPRAARAEVLTLNDTELCRKYTPAKFRQYYYPYRTHNSLLCITNCSLNVPGSIDCNSGLCRVTLEGPRCFCPDMPWYLTSGDRCQTHISQLGLGLGVGLGLGLTILILLILCIVLIICLAQRKKKSAGASMTGEESSWVGSRHNTHATGIYHVNGRGSMPQQGPYGQSSYKPNAEVAAPSMPVLAEGAASL